MMPNRFDAFLHSENIKNFEARIRAETHPGRLALLNSMLEQEKARMTGKKPPVAPLA
jgi:hypothetical protein